MKITQTRLATGMKSLLLLGLTLTFSLSTAAIEPGDKVKNFTLKDTQGNSHELYDLKDQEAVVIMIHGNGCPIVRNGIQAYQKIRDEYQPKNVTFLMLNANIQDNAKSIAHEAKEFSVDLPILVDKDQDVARRWGVERTADTFVIDPDTWTLAYRGNVDDRLGYETQKFEASEHYVKDALDEMLAGKPVSTDHTPPKGCLVSILDKS